MMRATWVTPVPGGHSASRGVTVLVTGILLAGGVSGLLFNRVLAASDSPARPTLSSPAGGAEAAAAASSLPLARSVPVVEKTGERAAGIPVRRTASALVAPPDPFQPTRSAPETAAVAAAPEAAPVEAPAEAGAPGEAGEETQGLEGPRKSSAPAPAVQAPPPEAMAVVGIIRGDPSLAVVLYEGQSFYLKVGDQVADTWRLEEIKERSAVFQLGAQRVEVPIKGGSS